MYLLVNMLGFLKINICAAGSGLVFAFSQSSPIFKFPDTTVIYPEKLITLCEYISWVGSQHFLPRKYGHRGVLEEVIMLRTCID